MVQAIELSLSSIYKPLVCIGWGLWKPFSALVIFGYFSYNTEIAVYNFLVLTIRYIQNGEIRQ